MMTQADIIARNEDRNNNSNQEIDSSNIPSQIQVEKPTDFSGRQFPSLHLVDFTEQSPIRPSKYFAPDRYTHRSFFILKIDIR
jgi:hypothetical protein